MSERMVDTLVVLENNTWWTGGIPKSTVDTICRAQEEGGRWHGEIVLKEIEHFAEGQNIQIRDLLIKHNGRRQGKN